MENDLQISTLKKEIVIDVTNQLSPLLSERAVIATLMSVFPSLRVKRALNILRQTQPMIIELGNTSTGKQKGFFDAIMYLFSIEASTNLITDIAIMLLAVKGHSSSINCKRYKPILNANSIEDLTVEKPYISLGDKLDFLNDCGLACFKKNVNTNLRNNIAHMDFDIDNDGAFFTYENQKGVISKRQIYIRQELQRITFFNSTVMHQIKVSVDREKESQRHGENAKIKREG